MISNLICWFMHRMIGRLDDSEVIHTKFSFPRKQAPMTIPIHSYFRNNLQDGLGT